MKKALNYGRITWAYEEDFDPESTCIPSPLLSFNPIRINGCWKYPAISDKTALLLLKLKGEKKISFKDAYRNWLSVGPWFDRDLGEGRAFLKWVRNQEYQIIWKKDDFKFHSYFMQEDSPRHDPQDDLAKDLSFAIRPVEVQKRKVKLYLNDDAVLNLINMPYGNEEDFLELVKRYIGMRFEWEKWKAPSPPFLDWVKAQAKRPVFRKGQLGLSLPAVHAFPA